MLITFCFIGLFVRLFILQGKNSEKLQLKAVSQWVRTLPLTAKRGQIKDINGTVLASSYTSYSVYIRAKEVENAVEVAEYLSNKLNLKFESVYEKAKNIYISEVLLKLQVEESLAKEIVEKNLSGVFVTENVARNYPYGNMSTQVLGFTTADGVGQSGVEAYYDKFLSGTDGKYLTQSDVKGLNLNESLRYYIEAKDGCDLTLTLDANIQKSAENVLRQIVIDHNPKKASILILDPNNGNIVALAITPSYDLNNIPRDDISSLMEMTKNIVVSDVYEPGSTFKILTLCAALSENLVDFDDRFYCPGYRIVDGERIKCWRTIGHGSQSLVEVVQNSCNCAFMDLALKLGKTKLYNYLQKFGIGSKTGVDISGESSGILMDINSVQSVDLARIGFGQAVAVSQLQLLSAFCSAINGGTLYQPKILNTITNSCGEVLQENKTLKTASVINSKVSQNICLLLDKSVNKTGENTFISGYSVGGKTGTAQKYENGTIARGKYVSSFFGFYPTDKPKYAMLVCVDEPSSGAYYGSVVAKPYGQLLFEQIIQYRNDAPISEVVVSKSIVLDDFVGLSLKDAILKLEKQNLSYEIDGEGKVVVGQYPIKNTVVNQNSTIILKT